jgi:AcrR family transcriptional regulator
MQTTRAHTGRARNDPARLAILDSAAALLMTRRAGSVNIDTIATAAGVGKQTIYRWWPSKGAVLLDAMVHAARRQAPDPNTGSLVGDLETFLIATFRAARRRANRALLRGAMAEALRDPHAAEVLEGFAQSRRQALRAILERGQSRGEIPLGDLDLAVDQVFGLLWYRLLFGHARPSVADAGPLAVALVAQLSDMSDR